MTPLKRTAIVLSVGLCGIWASPTRVAAQPQYELVSVGTDGTAAGLGLGYRAVFSGDGRFVAFESTSSTLVANDTNGASDIFVRDLLTHTTTRVSVASDGSQGTVDSTRPSLNYDGMLVAFTSASTLDPADTGCAGPCTDVYVRDRTRGLTTLVSIGATGGSGDGASNEAEISADGRFVVFTSAADNLVPGDTNGVGDVFLRDLAARTTTRLSLTSTGAEASAASFGGKISANGNIVTFVSAARLVTDPDPTPCFSSNCNRAYMLDRTTGTLTRLPLPTSALPASGGDVGSVDITPDGRLIAVSIDHIAVPASPPLFGTLMMVYDRQTQQNDVLIVANGGDIAINASGRFVSLSSGAVRTFFTGPAVFDRQTRATVPNTDLPLDQIGPAPTPTIRYSADGLRALLIDNAGRDSHDTNFNYDVYIVSHDVDHDGMPDAWETQYGLNPNDAADAALDSDGDGVSNLQEYFAGTHPAGTFKRYFAEGAANSFFSTRFAVFNPGNQATTAILEFLGSNGQVRSTTVPLAAHGWSKVELNEATTLQPDSDFSTIIEADRAVVVDRTMTWDKSGYGSHAETAIDAPGRTWYLAEGSTGGSFDLFYLLQNPGDVAANVTVNYLLPAPAAPIVKQYVVAPKSRRTIYVDQEGAALAGTDVSAKITADQPILAERAMYFSTPTQPFAAGHEGAAVSAPALSWFFAEGATGSFFDEFLLLANADTQDANVQVKYLLPSGAPIVKTYPVPAQSRLTVNVDFEDPQLLDTAVSAIVESQNGVPIIAERAMWWPSPNWYEAHLSAGATTTGTTWALADGLVTTTPGAETETYVLIANTSSTPGTADVTLFLSNGTSMTKTFALAANSRTNVQVRSDFPAAVDQGGFGTIIQSSGPPIVVERAMYTNATGQVWAAGSDALATKLQ